MAEENPADYGTPNYVYPLKGLPEQPLKKDVKAGKVITGDSAPKASTETPDPNVESVGDTTGPEVTDTTTTTRSTPRTSGT